MASREQHGIKVSNNPATSADLSVLSDVAPELAAALATLAGEIALVIDDEGVICNVAANDTAHPAHGWLGRPFAETVTGATRRKIELLLADVAVPGVTRRREVNHPAGAGEVPVSYAAVRLGPAGPVIAVGRDLRAVAAIQQRMIDARQEMERDYWKLRQEETRQRLLAQVASDAVMVIDATTLERRRSNAAATALFGPAGTPLAAAVQDILALAGRSDRPGEVRTRVVAGGPLIDLSATPLRVPLDGALAHCLLVRARLAVADEAGPETAAIAVVDSGGHVRVGSVAFLALCRTDGEPVAGRTLMELLGDPRRELAALLADARRDGIAQRAGLALGSGAAPIEIDATATLIADGDQECLGLVLQRTQASSFASPANPFATLFERIGERPLDELIRLAAQAAERLAIDGALQRVRGDAAAAASMLGLSPDDLAQRRRRHDIAP